MTKEGEVKGDEKVKAMYLLLSSHRSVLCVHFAVFNIIFSDESIAEANQQLAVMFGAWGEGHNSPILFCFDS